MTKNLQLSDPFWTSGLVNRVEEFWGRDAELGGLEANIKRSGIAITGPVGIGKSSLLSMMRLMLEGFNTDLNSVCTLAMCGSEDEPWHLARKLFRHFRRVTIKKVQERGIDLKGLVWKETTAENDLNEDDYITAVYEILTDLSSRNQFDYIVVLFDESHKCPIALAELIRSLKEQLEHEGIAEVRFMTAGIGAYVDKMVKHDSGIGRAFQNHFKLTPWEEEIAKDFVRNKLQQVVSESEEHGLEIEVRGTHDDDLETVFYRLSGGHPFLTQLLGSYLIRHENSDPDDVLDSKDLVGAMQEICGRTRSPEYSEMIATLESSGMKDSYKRLTTSLTQKAPSQISRSDFDLAVGEDGRTWFLENGFVFESGGVFQLTDELLRVSVMLQEDAASASQEEQDILEDDEDDEDNEFDDFDE